MITIRQIERLWAARTYRKLVAELLSAGRRRRSGWRPPWVAPSQPPRCP